MALYINKKSGINFAKNIQKENKITIRPNSKNKITKTKTQLTIKRKLKDLEKLLDTYDKKKYKIITEVENEKRQMVGGENDNIVNSFIDNFKKKFFY